MKQMTFQPESWESSYIDRFHTTWANLTILVFDGRVQTAGFKYSRFRECADNNFLTQNPTAYLSSSLAYQQRNRCECEGCDTHELVILMTYLKEGRGKQWDHNLTPKQTLPCTRTCLGELLVRLSCREEVRFKDHLEVQEWSSTMSRSLGNSGRRISHMYKEFLTELRHKNEAFMRG